MTSWLKSAVYKAVEVGGNNNLTRTVRSYAESAVQQAGFAVTEGARLIQDRIGPRNLQSIRHTVKRLEEVSVSSKGVERVQLLRRWLVALKETERLSAADNYTNYKNYSRAHSGINKNDLDQDYNYIDTNSNVESNYDDQFSYEESKDSPRNPILIYYVDPDIGSEPMTFREVFLLSRALEGMTLSMILEAPTDEEIMLLQEIFRLCLTGGKEVQNSVMASIQSLAHVFSKYEDEVLVKREELLEYAQAAIAGLKINADLARIDTEVSRIKEKLENLKKVQITLNDNHEKSAAPTEALIEARGQLDLCFKLEELLLKKKSLSNGDPPERHNEKVHKLKVLSESLINSTAKAEKRILDHRYQKEEALGFRVAKSNEVSQTEKELGVEISALEHKKDDLEAQLKQVNLSLAAAKARLHNAREERDQFDNASNDILVHLKSKEDEIAKSITSCRVEADVVNAWVNFLEDTWAVQTTHTEQKEKQVSGDLEKYGEYFVNLVTDLLSSYKEHLGPSISRIRELESKLSSNEGSDGKSKDENSSDAISRKNLEEEFKDLETKFVVTFSVVDSMRNQFYSTNAGIQRKNDNRAKELFDALGDIKLEFDSIDRPTLEIESPTKVSSSPSLARSLSLNLSLKSPWSPSTSTLQPKKGENVSPIKEEDTELNYELGVESGDHFSDEDPDEIADWEFDAFDKDVRRSV